MTKPPYDSGKIELPIISPEGLPAGPPKDKHITVVLAGWFETPSASRLLPTVLISSETAQQLGFEIRPGPRTVLDLPAPVTNRQRDRLHLLDQDRQWEHGLQLAQPAPETGPFTQVSFLTPEAPAPISPAQVRAAVLAASLLLVLAVVAVGLALAAKDSEDERQVLVAVGAPLGPCDARTRCERCCSCSSPASSRSRPDSCRLLRSWPPPT